MSKENKKHIEDLYALVKSMSRTDRVAFSNDSLTGQHSYVSLFEALVKTKTKAFDKSKLIPKVAPSEQVLYHSARYLAQKILEWLAVKEHSSRWELTMIKKAIRNGFYSIGLSVLKKQFIVAWNQKDLFYLRELYELKHKLYKHYGLKLELKKEIIKQNALLDELSTVLRSEVIYRKIKAAFPTPPSERIRTAKEVVFETENFSLEGLQPRSKFKVFKTKEALCLLKGEFSDALNFQQNIQNLIGGSQELFSIEERVDECILLITLLVNEGLFSSAEKAVFQLGMLEPETNFQKQKITNGWVYCALIVSAGSAKKDIGLRATKEFERISNSLTPQRRILMLYLISIVHFYESRWENVISFQNRMARHGKVVPEKIKASSYLIRGLAKYEIGHFEESVQDLDNFEKYSDLWDLKYPQAASQGVKSLMNLNFSNTSLLLDNLHEEIEGFGKNEEEQPLIWMFDIRPWVLSKKSGQSISGIINSQNIPGLVQIKLGS